jgi:hypothetical protein
MAGVIIFKDREGRKKRKFKIKGSKRGGNGKKTIPEKDFFCPLCNLVVAPGDPDGEDINKEKKQHKSCERRLAFARSKNTEFRESANL